MPHANLQFAVLAIGFPPLSFQWSLDGTNLTDNAHIAGSGTSRLTITDSVLANAGRYSLIVTNPFGSATSSVAVLSALPPTLTIIPPSNSVTIGYSCAGNRYGQIRREQCALPT